MSSTRTPRKLDPVEIRVLGVLLEKEQTTPEACPLSLNAVIAGANQKTNREPVTQLSEEQVGDALERLRQEVLVWRTEGARSERWQQSVVRRWGLERAGKALMTLLLLRGPQTAGELRTRSERMFQFGSLQEVEDALRAMAEIDEPLVQELPRRPGQKETRWTHLVGDIPEWTEEAAGTAPPEPARHTPPAPPADLTPSPTALSTISSRLSRLEETVAKLSDDLEALKDLLS